MTEQDCSQALAETVAQAGRNRAPLRIIGSNSKGFYGRETQGKALSMAGHVGIVGYEPTELVLTARSGTPLTLIESALADQEQMLPFEPPHFGPSATLGGAIACGLSGPRRPYIGAARDFVLGVTLLNGQAERLRFGGQVMKNVAGYDVSRLMVGSMGTLGVLLEISLKILPAPQSEITLALEQEAEGAIKRMNALAARPLPLSATCHYQGILYIRLSGTETAVASAQKTIGGTMVDGSSLWQEIREHTHAFFLGPKPLWRLSLPSTTPPLELPGTFLIDWGGAQRWLRADVEAKVIRAAAARNGGYATLFRGQKAGEEVFHPLNPTLLALHRRLKAAFDPLGILNPGRMYREI